MMEKVCVVHYPGLEDYSISEVNENRLRYATILRRQVSSCNYHKEQCDTIPDIIGNTKHGRHLVSCYKKFTLILSDKTRNSSVKVILMIDELLIDCPYHLHQIRE